MANKLPERFMVADPDEVCGECDRHRKLCRDCDRCFEHCECPEVCTICGGLWGPMAWDVARVRGVEECTCVECIICRTKINADHADHGYGLSEEQAQNNWGCSSTVVCEACVEAKRTPPPPEKRGFIGNQLGVEI